ESLRASLDTLDLSRQLATIRCDVELEHSPASLRRQEPDIETLRDWYQKLEFNSWLRQLDDQAPEAAQPAASAPVDAEYETLLTQKQLDAWLERLQQAELFAFDTETTSLRYMEARIVG